MQEDTTIPYSRPQSLVERPIIPDEQDVDILLSGVLAIEEDIWSKRIITLLDTLLVEDDIEMAFLIMREWADEVLKIRGPGALRTRKAYLQFIVEMMRQSQQWERALIHDGYRPRRSMQPALEILKQWLRENPDPPTPLGAFAEDLLRELEVIKYDDYSQSRNQ